MSWQKEEQNCRFTFSQFPEDVLFLLLEKSSYELDWLKGNESSLFAGFLSVFLAIIMSKIILAIIMSKLIFFKEESCI